MDCKGTSWLKKEKNEVYAEPGSLVQLHTSIMKVKEELDEQVDQQCLEDNLGTSWPNDFIKEDPELNLEVAASLRNASDSLRALYTILR
ncbi:uncharacterized protein LOC126427094 isoform X15 [Schistocerca serialis cubense]|uniref:uncharacterized protein LOC126427094 isoform X15 n=1 Tax=Schistocerca serialis cubense TaxID=2023355 RepID=UPI00214E64A2|nr:uncharacterized protein LOC126427094 isoform X15 [Schistocerca serialis cubense]